MPQFLLWPVFGYLVGSISPGYFFGRLAKKLDLREFGDRNTGATNTYRIVGPIYGVITAIFDFGKAAAFYYSAQFFLGADAAIPAALFVVLGHVKPFYLGFRGGKGVAAILGLIGVALFFTQSVYAFAMVLGAAAYWFYLVKGKIALEAPTRKILKLSALIPPLSLIWFPQVFLARIVGGLFAAFLVFDVSRMLSPKLNEKYLGASALAKQKEKRRFSGYTLFTLSAFLLLLFFEREIAVVALVFFILGDTFAPFASASVFLPRVKLAPQKTLGGAMVIFAAAFLAGIFLNSLTPLISSLPMVALGAFLAAALDQFSFLLDDNLLVPLGVAAGLTAVSRIPYFAAAML